MRRTRYHWPVAGAGALIALAATLVAGGWLWSTAGNAGLQAAGGWLTLPMQVFTFLGDEQFYLVAIPLVYWCIHKELGADLGVLLVLSSFINGAIKSTIKHQRPFWEAGNLQLGDASSFSTPSGHAQTSAALFGYLASVLSGRRRGKLAVAGLALLIALVALSRVYLGVHFVGDILWGAAIGLLIIACYTWAKPRLLPGLRRLPLALHVVLALALGAAIIGFEALLRTVPIGDAAGFTLLYEEAMTATVEESATVAGLAVGLWLGLVLEARYVGFVVAGKLWQRAVRYVAGVAGLFAIWMGLRVIFPQEPLALGLALRTVRYGLAMFWAIAGWPWLFVRLRLGRTASSGGGIADQPARPDALPSA